MDPTSFVRRDPCMWGLVMFEIGMYTGILVSEVEWTSLQRMHPMVELGVGGIKHGLDFYAQELLWGEAQVC